MKKVKGVVAGLLTVVLLAGCSTTESQEDTSADTASQVDTTEVVKKDTSEHVEPDNASGVPEELRKKDTTTEEEPEIVKVDPYIKHTIMEEQLNDTFEGLFEVEFIEESNAFMLMASSSDIATEIKDAMIGDPVAVMAWNSMAEEFLPLSEMISEFTGDTNTGISIYNPFDRDKVLLVVQNGVMIYNFTEE